MKKRSGTFMLCAAAVLALGVGLAQQARSASYITDTVPTAKGELKITPINHATLFLEQGGKVIVVDPVSAASDYSGLPKADLVLIREDKEWQRRNSSGRSRTATLGRLVTWTMGRRR